MSIGCTRSTLSAVPEPLCSTSRRVLIARAIRPIRAQAAAARLSGDVPSRPRGALASFLEADVSIGCTRSTHPAALEPLHSPPHGLLIELTLRPCVFCIRLAAYRWCLHGQTFHATKGKAALTSSTQAPSQLRSGPCPRCASHRTASGSVPQLPVGTKAAHRSLGPGQGRAGGVARCERPIFAPPRRAIAGFDRTRRHAPGAELYPLERMPAPVR